ncbi:hypothetical protein SISSUDRAFT_1048762 [Sistotremastrum suecicum HHB10207 ss-3]|uniref:DUF6697 domain-containing protein n=1 Tax=Sistotremastrum suecicum HHB10207 ss-3 TaxID=1314776 RepID=A0A166C9G9_9AGAM|nr:hypothetical protein SISSUDRAFT_1048762 [Sistotremastrum suecicum HHB10207 ss-3]
MPSTRSSSRRDAATPTTQRTLRTAELENRFSIIDIEDSEEEDVKPVIIDKVKKEKVDHATIKPMVVKEEKPDIKIKVKKEEEFPLTLDEDSLIRRYNQHGCRDRHLPYSPDVLNRTYTRQHISNHYGGNVQETWVKVAQHRVRDGIRYYVCPRLNWNPHMPRKPGECGVLFFGSGEVPDHRSFPMFGRVRSGEWQYYGDYQFRTSEPLSVREWRETSLETKMAWFKAVSTLKGWAYHEINTVTLVRKIREGGVSHLEVDDLEEGLVRGEWMLSTSTCRCTAYNVEMQRVLLGEDFEELEEKPDIKEEEKPVVKTEEKPVKEEVKLEVKSETKPVLRLDDDITEIKVEAGNIHRPAKSPKKRAKEDDEELDQLPDESPSPSKRTRQSPRFYIGSGHGSKSSPIEIL